VSKVRSAKHNERAERKKKKAMKSSSEHQQEQSQVVEVGDVNGLRQRVLPALVSDVEPLIKRAISLIKGSRRVKELNPSELKVTYTHTQARAHLHARTQRAHHHCTTTTTTTHPPTHHATQLACAFPIAVMNFMCKPSR
jgi:hypothetical protein